MAVFLSTIVFGALPFIATTSYAHRWGSRQLSFELGFFPSRFSFESAGFPRDELISF